MISLKCLQCDAQFLTASPLPHQDSDVFLAAWKLNAQQNKDMFICVGCGGEFELQDDGVAVSEGGSVTLHDMSKPRIDSVTISYGDRTGGLALYVMGAALDVGTLVIKFGGRDVLNITDRRADRARVTTPPARYTLNVAETVSGTFVVGEAVRGKNSSAQGVVVSISPFVVDNPTAAFQAHEDVVGVASKAVLRLMGTPYSSVLDVTVENENGQRLVGGTLVGGFTYQ